MKAASFVISIVLIMVTLAGFTNDPIPGLLGQAILGAFHVFCCFLYAIGHRNLTARAKKHLKTYGIIVLSYAFIAVIMISAHRLDSDFRGIGIGIVVPLCIAVYFTIISWIIYKERNIEVNKRKRTNNPSLDAQLIEDETKR